MNTGDLPASEGGPSNGTLRNQRYSTARSSTTLSEQVRDLRARTRRRLAVLALAVAVAAGLLAVAWLTGRENEAVDRVATAKCEELGMVVREYRYHPKQPVPQSAVCADTNSWDREIEVGLQSSTLSAAVVVMRRILLFAAVALSVLSALVLGELVNRMRRTTEE